MREEEVKIHIDIADRLKAEISLHSHGIMAACGTRRVQDISLEANETDLKKAVTRVQAAIADQRTCHQQVVRWTYHYHLK